MTRVLEGAVAHAAAASGKSDFLDLVFLIQPKHSAAADEDTSSSLPTLTTGQQQGYADLMELLLLRAHAAAAAELPFTREQLQTLGVSIPEQQQEADCLQGIQQRSSTTGLQLTADGRVLLPPHMSKTCLIEKIAAADQETIQALLLQQPQQQQQQEQQQQQQEQQQQGGPLDPAFGVSLLYARNVRRQLWKQLAEFDSSKGDCSCSTKETAVADFVSLDTWLSIYERLQQAGELLLQQQETGEAAAAWGESLQQQVVKVQEEQQQSMLLLLSSKLQEEGEGIAQLAANLKLEGTEDEAATAAAAAELAALSSRTATLQQTAAQLGLPRHLLQQATDSLFRAAQQSHNEEVPFVATGDEETNDDPNTPGIGSPHQQKPHTPTGEAETAEDVHEEDDENINMVEFDFD
ncbi:hypothetical protein, conserved [Eimeria acervulina]|uniref:Uncharacterized protein n=1 Tax=Eimeria acervulina TaxID=5801 RepID=U6GLT3_EIMAC|nr:hypothetical protein, conserved [Eimeria acervulina]CDI81186.1 hypothetical protein, conserved [Eimeria acervulina]